MFAIHPHKKEHSFYYGWAIVASCSVCTSGYGLFQTLGVFFSCIRTEYGWSATLVSSIHSVHCICWGISLPIMAWLSSRYGMRCTFLLGSLLIGVGFSLCSQVVSIFDYYLFYGIASVGAAVTTSLPMALVQRWFLEKRGLVLGLVSGGFGVGAMLYPIGVSLIISRLGWRAGYLIMGTGVGVIMVFAAFFMVDFPEKLGMQARGPDLRGVRSLHSDAAREVCPTGVEDISWTLKNLFQTKAFYMICTMWFFASMATHLVIVHLVPFAEDLGMPKGEAASVFGIIGGIGIFSRVFSGVCSSRLGWKKALVICAFCIALALIWLSFSADRWMVYVFVVSYGIFFGVRLTVIPGLIGEYFGVRSLPEVMSYFWAVAAFSGLVGALIGGMVVDITGYYRVAFGIGSIWYLIVTALAILLKPPFSNRYAV